MASEVADRNQDDADAPLGQTLTRVLGPLASLRLTVVLFALSIVLVMFGTLAQHRKDIWQVMDEYFRCFVATVEIQDLLPGSFFGGVTPDVSGAFPFPGGWVIGGLMFLNLLAAHAIRFKPQSSGTRFAAGCAIIAAGIGMTWMVIASGSNKDGLQQQPWLEWAQLWELFKGGLAAGWLALLYAMTRMQSPKRLVRNSMLGLATVWALAVIWLYYQGDAARLDDSSMRILWQLMKGTFAGLVLLAGCWLVFKKRAGVVLLHAGVGLLMINEVLVGNLAVEGQMQIDEGKTVNYVQDIRSLELAVIDDSDPKQDAVVVVPKSVLLSGTPIQHPELPFDLTVDTFYPNSDIRELRTSGDNPDRNPADQGAGLRYIAEERRPVSGTDSSGQVDIPSAYITVCEKDGEPIGTYLVSLLLKEQPVQVGDKTYDVGLRFKRTYKDFSVHLLDVRKDDYVGTDTPRDYRSTIQLVDEKRGVVLKDHEIWMNNPLRYAGETFYQSSYHRDPQSGQEATTLAVVTNTGWMIPYVSCMLVATGMLAHFMVVLLRFLNRRAAAAQTPVPASRWAHENAGGHIGASIFVARLTALVVVVILGGWLAGKARPPATATSEVDFYAFGQIPVVYQGRAKPIDTLARNSLRIISDREEYTDAAGEKQPAIRLLLDLMTEPETAFGHQVFRIESLELQNLLGLERRKRFRYAFNEFRDKLPELQEQASKARELDTTQLDTLQRKVLDLEQKIGVVHLLMSAFSTPEIRPENAREDLFAAIQQQQALQQRHPPLAVPPAEDEGRWQTYGEAWLRSLIARQMTNAGPDAATEAWTRIMIAYASDDAGTFNSEVADYKAWLGSQNLENLNLEKTSFESYFNHFAPFYHSAALYLIAFVLVAASWLGWWRPLNTASLWLIVFTLAVHTFAIVARIYISGRPPVTNLYSSAVFIGWGAVVLGIVLEVIYRIGIGNVIASISGFSTLLIAHFLAGDGDTFTVLQAVLDTQFWLATHVVCITLGYATTYVAGLLGLLYVVRGVFTPSLTPEVGRQLARMIYGTICFAIFFSFVGTVLGGLWADDSWGRFWGWDPKENGALIIVLWNALVLHARWGGLVKDRGLALLAIGGNIVTSWSWFGVNELGVGLHSYGFTEGVLLTLGVFVLSQLAVIAVGLIPKQSWWSSQRHPA